MSSKSWRAGKGKAKEERKRVFLKRKGARLIELAGELESFACNLENLGFSIILQGRAKKLLSLGEALLAIASKDQVSAKLIAELNVEASLFADAMTFDELYADLLGSPSLLTEPWRSGA